MKIKAGNPYLLMHNRTTEALNYYKSLGFKTIVEFFHDEESAKMYQGKVGEAFYAVLNLSNLTFSIASSQVEPQGGIVVLFEDSKEDIESFSSLFKLLAKDGAVMHDLPEVIKKGEHACLDDKFGIS